MFMATEEGLLREFVYKAYLGENKEQEENFRSILIKR
jgi:hypothetical protein